MVVLIYISTNDSPIYIYLYIYKAQYTFFSAAHKTFSKVDNILGHKESLNEYKTLQ
jgi:hypothetical protein